jgi:hypothetical protein
MLAEALSALAAAGGTALGGVLHKRRLMVN